MKTMPWQDIIKVDDWDALLQKYIQGQLQSKAKTKGAKFSYFFTRKYKLPKTITALDRGIRHYHNIGKRSLENLPVRAGALRVIAGTARMFLDQHKAAENARDQVKKDINQRLNSPQNIAQRWEQARGKSLGFGEKHRVEKGKATRDQIFQERYDQAQLEEYRGEYSAYKDRSFDYVIAKILRRAVRKAQYIEQLRWHVRNADRGFTSDKQNLLAYIKSRIDWPSDDMLVRMKSDSILERIDPWHRTYEATFDPNLMKLKASNASVFAAAFNQWLDDDQHADTPFFVWLEGHYVCTAIEDKRLLGIAGEMIYQEPEGKVSYYQSDNSLPSRVNLVSAQAGSMWAYKIKKTGAGQACFEFDVDLHDTTHVKGDRKTAEKEAYVWSRDGYMFTAQHKGGQFHHSSFVSGKKVKCAGMIRVVGGKVTKVDNFSGHYQPQTRHLRNFVNFLQMQNVFAVDARVEDQSTKPYMIMGVQEFLTSGKLDRLTRLRRIITGLKTRTIKLRDLVEERFQAMKIEIGPSAPEHLLWTRAYKTVCLELGEIDAKWSARANAPPIPRTGP